MRAFVLRQAAGDGFGLAVVFAAVGALQAADHRQHESGTEAAGEIAERPGAPARRRITDGLAERFELLAPDLGMGLLAGGEPGVDLGKKIGRATCRERVCRYG